MTIITATVSTVKIGLIEIEGLMLSDGSFGVAVQQAASLISVSQDHASRDLKALLYSGSQFAKVKTDRNTGTKQNRLN